MTRARCTFRERDVTAAIRAAKAGGVSVARIEIHPDGGVTIVAGEPEGPDSDVNKLALERLENALSKKKPPRHR
jgi:hypothetical protein